MGIKNKKILITCGPTWVPVDDVRVISNMSSGTLGQTCAKICQEKGAKVTLLQGPGTETIALTGTRRIRFQFFTELEDLLKKELNRKYDIVIHAAAVSDFKLKRPFSGKTSSGQNNLTLSLVPTKKIINSIKKTSPDCFLVGFKMEPYYRREPLLKKAQGLLKQASCDAVVANALKPGYQAFIVYKDGTVTAPLKSKLKLIKYLIQDLETRL